MARFDYDTIFYRVFCATILGIAFTFTVILTNVFIDIDGLLSKKDDSVPQSIPNSIEDRYKTMENNKNEVEYNDETTYLDEADSYRAKRSLEPDDLMSQVKNPNIKKILTNKLATLLEELDEEESNKSVKSEKETRRKEDLDEPGNDNMLHLAMHNILLQGIIGHMDLNDVYKKVHLLIRNFYNTHNSDKQKQENDKTEVSKEFEVEQVKIPNTEENKFFEELLKCKTLQNQLKGDVKNKTLKLDSNYKEPKKLFIKTIIEINENRKLNNDYESQDKDIIGLIKLIYNGKSIKFQKMDDEETQKATNKPPIENNASSKIKQIHNNAKNNNEQNVDENLMSNPVFNKVIETYLKQHSINNSPQIDDKKTNRLKRQIKIHYRDKNGSTHKPKPTHDKIKKDDEELYIEIETHFDGKGSKGEKKKKLVRNLIDKIQKAIHEDSNNEHDKKISLKHIRVKKRNQDPIKPKHGYFLSNIVPSLLNVDHREVDPIGKILPVENILDNHGENWKRTHYGPSFLNPSKSVNSAEMGELVIRYDSILKDEIPKRIQKPLTGQDNKSDSNNMTFYLKDIDGSGFSVGFNQYVDEPPDTDSLKLFNGLENLIQEYHKSYDSEDVNNIDKVDNIVDEQYTKRQQESLKTTHDITRRSVKSETPTNYRAFLKRMIFPLTFYKNVIGNSKLRQSISNDHFAKKSNYQMYPENINIISKPIRIKDLTIAFSNNYYNEITPRQNFNKIQRKKRSLIVQKISNLKSKIKLNKFLNTKKLINKKLYLKSKRNKRQINKIRIIARDRVTRPEKPSNENLLLVTPDSYPGKKTLVKDTEIPDMAEESDTQNGDFLPLSEFLDYSNQPISPLEGQKLQQAALMSKYPHIFFEEMPKSKEYSEEKPIKPYRIQARRQRLQPNEENFNTDTLSNLQNVRVPGVEDIVNAVLPQAKSNYRITVKITPKNISSELNSGFKEIHTSVNKSYDKNGLRYFSSLNVSQISKVENLTDTDTAKTQNVSDLSRKFMPMTMVKKVDGGKEKMKLLLELHQKRIDEQLENLQQERLFLENFLDERKESIPYYQNVPVNVQVFNTDPTSTSTTTIQTTTRDTTTIPSTMKVFEVTTKRTVSDEEKDFLITTIKHNDNATKEILRKIDDNTKWLMMFLNKLTAHLEKDKERVDWKDFAPKNQLFRQMYEFRNNTQAIPYIYAFSPPAENPSLNSIFPENNAIKTNNLKQNVKPVNNFITRNQSRFFIDELENMNPDVSATIKINTTHV